MAVAVSDYERWLLKLMVWRESRGTPAAWAGVTWSVLNRVAKGGWWGSTVAAVITHPFQYSSMTAVNDPNERQWPLECSCVGCMAVWENIGVVVDDVLAGRTPDPTSGATYYYSYPLTEPPVAWGQVTETLVAGTVHFCIGKETA